jgi:hypothetical protein
VDVNKPGGDQASRRIYLVPCRRIQQADVGYHVTIDGDVCPVWLGSAAVDHSAASNDQVKHELPSGRRYG